MKFHRSSRSRIVVGRNDCRSLWRLWETDTRGPVEVLRDFMARLSPQRHEIFDQLALKTSLQGLRDAVDKYRSKYALLEWVDLYDSTLGVDPPTPVDPSRFMVVNDFGGRFLSGSDVEYL